MQVVSIEVSAPSTRPLDPPIPGEMRALRVAWLCLPLALGTGCFVFDEIDAGMKIMDAHSPKANLEKRKAEEEAAQTAQTGKAQSYQQLVGSWWKDAMSLSTAEGGDDGGDPMVRCSHAGHTLYTKRSDCLARGGRAG